MRGSGGSGYCPLVAMLRDKLTADEHFELFARSYELGADEPSSLATPPLPGRNAGASEPS